MRSEKNDSLFDVPVEQLALLFKSSSRPATVMKRILFLVGTVLMPITLAGAVWGYMRSYNRFLRPYDQHTRLDHLPPIVKIAMVIGGVLAWLVIVAAIGSLFLFWRAFDFTPAIIITYLATNLVLSFLVYGYFTNWRNRVDFNIAETYKFGSARFARPDELTEYQHKEGFYIGGGHSFNDKGHILTVAGTRGGKGTNLIIPNLLGLSDYKGSLVVIDPKGENCAISARAQHEMGRRVVVLNPWDLLPEHIMPGDSYNPLDLLSDKNNIHLVDDVQIIAEMLVPIEKGDKNRFFTDNARAIVAGFIMQIVSTQTGDKRNLATLWKWVRLTGEPWDRIIAEMRESDDPVNGEIIRNAGNEIVKLSEAGEETFGSIISTVIQCTDFLKSPALQKSMQSGFNPYDLAKGNIALYIIIPADKLQSHSRWLRLVVTSTLRAVIRKPNKRVCFLLDEFAALGYLPEIETALSTYAGYEVTIWPILQSLIQLKNLYGDNWESFTANSTIRQFFSVNDNFTAEYVSKAIGETSHITRKNWLGSNNDVANARALITPDELRRYSGENIFAFFGSKPATMFPKLPYYKIKALNNKSDENPYL